MANLTRGKNFEKMKSHILHVVAKSFLSSGYHATTLREVVVGKALAITDSGVLQIEKEDGSIAEVYSADIELI